MCNENIAAWQLLSHESSAVLAPPTPATVLMCVFYNANGRDFNIQIIAIIDIVNTIRIGVAV